MSKGLLRRSVNRAIREWDMALEAVGRPCMLYRRKDVLPNTPGSDRSTAYGAQDFADAGYVSPTDDRTLYHEPEETWLSGENPSERAGVAEVELLQGEGLMYSRLKDNITEGDLVVMDGIKYTVTSSRLPVPTTYRILLVRRTS